MCLMRSTTRFLSRGACLRSGAAAIEMAIAMSVFMLLILGCIDFGRFASTFISVTNAASAGAEAGIMSQYPDPDLTTGNGLVNWQMNICHVVADELGTSHDFGPAGSADPNGYTNSQGVYVSA